MSWDHSSRKETERGNVERLRTDGIPADLARNIARDASEQAHRQNDRKYSDRRR